MALDFNLTRNGVTFNVNCPVSAVDFDNNGITANLHYDDTLGEAGSKSFSFDQAEVLQAAIDANENGPAFLDTYKAIIEQLAVTKFGN